MALNTPWPACGVPLVVVMGHTRCGGVAASLQNAMTARSAILTRSGERATGEGFIGNWVALAGSDARTRSETEGGVRCPRASERARSSVKM